MYVETQTTDYELLFCVLVLLQVLAGIAIDQRRDQCLAFVKKAIRTIMGSRSGA